MTKDDILRNNLYLNLATVCEDGKPWNTPLFYSYDGKILCWWSPITAIHSLNIARDNNVFVTIYDSTTPIGNGSGLYLQGTAHEILPENIDYPLASYCEKAKSFMLNKSDCIGNAPARLYQFDIQNMWMNSETEVDGVNIDVREEIV